MLLQQLVYGGSCGGETRLPLRFGALDLRSFVRHLYTLASEQRAGVGLIPGGARAATPAVSGHRASKRDLSSPESSGLKPSVKHLLGPAPGSSVARPAAVRPDITEAPRAAIFTGFPR